MATDGAFALESAEALGRLLCEAGLLDDPRPAIEPAGDGNINWVRRVRSRRSGRTLIVKHARQALERFPEYEASTERIVFEHRYFTLAREDDPEGVCPPILYFDAPRRLLVLEDLGRAERLDSALLRGADTGAALRALARFLGRVHARTWAAPDLASRFRNQDIQRLHGDHIFKLPYEENGFPLPDAVRARADEIRVAGVLGGVAARAYARFREPRGALVHADVQPGNVLLRADGPTLLDAEIAHVGDPAFDVGTLLAHVWLARLVAPVRETAAARTGEIWTAYETTLGPGPDVRFADVARYAGLEMMRRTIGAARVRAVEAPEAALRAIDVAAELITTPPETPEAIPIP